MERRMVARHSADRRQVLWGDVRERHAHLAGCRFAWTYVAVAAPLDPPLRLDLYAAAARHHPVLGRLWGDVERRGHDHRRRAELVSDARGAAAGGRPPRSARALHLRALYLVARRRRLRDGRQLGVRPACGGARRRSLRKPCAEQSGRYLLARCDRHCQRLDLQLHGRAAVRDHGPRADQRICLGPHTGWRSSARGQWRVHHRRGRRRPSLSAPALRRAAGTVSAVGVGVDLVEVSRARAMLADKGAHVFDRLLTPAEAEYCRSRPDPAEHVAVRLAAKEAVYKALQGSDAARGIGWRDIEVTRAPDGRPDVLLTGIAERRAKELRVKRVLLSLSHTHEAAVAIAVLSTD